MLAFISELINAKASCIIRLSFLIAGHTKVSCFSKLHDFLIYVQFDPDRLFAIISAILRVHNIFTLEKMKQLILQVVPFCIILTANSMYNFSTIMTKLYTKMEAISTYHEFYFESKDLRYFICFFKNQYFQMFH